MKKLYRRSISGLLARLICFTAILGSGVTAFPQRPPEKQRIRTRWRSPETETPIWITAALGATTSCTT